MDIFLEVSTPDDLAKHLFLSFVRVPQPANIDGKTLKVSTLRMKKSKNFTLKFKRRWDNVHSWKLIVVKRISHSRVLSNVPLKERYIKGVCFWLLLFRFCLFLILCYEFHTVKAQILRPTPYSKALRTIFGGFYRTL